MSTYNPQSKWDWYEVGGRWTGFLKMKNNIQLFADKTGFSISELDNLIHLYETNKQKFTKIISKYVGKVDEIMDFMKTYDEIPKPITGRGGVFGNVAEVGWGDQMLKNQIDIVGMQEEAKAKAIESWNKVNDIIKGESFIAWSEFVAMVEKKEMDIDKARELYHDQEVIKRWDKEASPFDEISRYAIPLEEFIARSVNSVLSTYAIVKNGVWYAKGEMGWFGMSDDKQTQDEWNEEVMKMFNELPNDTLITIVDCHI